MFLQLKKLWSEPQCNSRAAASRRRVDAMSLNSSGADRRLAAAAAEDWVAACSTWLAEDHGHALGDLADQDLLEHRPVGVEDPLEHHAGPDDLAPAPQAQHSGGDGDTELVQAED